jgi:hypothetical protein
MRCLYCGKELALFKRLTGGAEFCSDAHRQQYQEEYNQLALTRLLQASPLPDGPAKPVRLLSSAESTPETAAQPQLGTLIDPDLPANFGGLHETRPAGHSTGGFSVYDNVGPAPEPSSPLSALTGNVKVHNLGPAPEPPPPQPAGFLVAPFQAFSSDVPALAPSDVTPSAAELVWNDQPAFPESTGLITTLALPGLAGAIPMDASVSAHNHQAVQQDSAALEVAEVLRPVPDLVSDFPASAALGLEQSDRPVEVSFFPSAPGEEGSLWTGAIQEFTHFTTELGDLSRLAFATLGWDEIARREGIELPSPAAQQAPVAPVVEPPVAEPAAEIPEPVVEPPSAPAVAKPAVVRPVSKAVVAPPRPADVPKPVVKAEPPPAAAVPVVRAKASPMAARIEEIRAQRRQDPPQVPVSATTQLPRVEPDKTESVPGMVTKPLPLTLHGHAPAKGKPVQIFPAALAKVSGVHVPRSTSLPLRPTMVFGAAPVAPAPAAEPAKPAVAAPPTIKITPAATPIAKREAPKSDVKVPLTAKSEPKAETKVQAEPVVRTQTPPKSLLKPTMKNPSVSIQSKPVSIAPTPKEEPPAAPATSSIAVEEKPVETREAAKQVKPAPQARKTVRPTTPDREFQPEEPKALAAEEKPAPEVKTAPRKEASVPVPLPYPDLDLGLPSMSSGSPGFWAKLPVPAKAAIGAAILVLIAVGVLYFTKGSSTSKGPVVVAAGTVLSSGDAGWLTDWAPDPSTSKRQRRISVMRASQSLSDYRMELEGQIETKALGWVYRTSNQKNFYVNKIEIVKPGLEPTIQLVRFAVIDGVEQPRQNVPLSLKVRPDTVYKIKFEAMGDRFTTWVMDQKVDEWTDARIKSGGIGLYSENTESLSLKGTVNLVPLVVRR